jgi:Zn-dependent protease
MTDQHVTIFYQIIAFLFAISVHESAHAWTANRCGDPTATMLGRVTLNPIKHIDPLGTIILPIIAAITHLPLIGWAKPTPVDPRNFKSPVRDEILVSIAGPISNFIVATFAAVVMVVLIVTSKSASPETSSSVFEPLLLMFYVLLQINVLLAIFNLIPLPPLDGSHVLRQFLSEGARRIYDNMGMVSLILLMFLAPRFFPIVLNPVMGFYLSIVDGLVKLF